ncbi:hypothetical protein EBU71_17300, partial [bacterium]|nr:hypothetical protein [Candidatus Elulimicrobium humile]
MSFELDYLESELAHYQLGTTLLIKDGTYTDICIGVTVSGHSNKPLIIKAENQGCVIVKGNSQIALYGDNITLEGFEFDCSSTEPATLIYGNENRITQCTFRCSNVEKNTTGIKIVNSNSRIDHCNFSNLAYAIVLDSPLSEVYSIIDHNDFVHTGQAMNIISKTNTKAMFLFNTVSSTKYTNIHDNGSHNIYYKNTWIKSDHNTIEINNGNSNIVYMNKSEDNTNGALISGAGHIYADNFIKNSGGVALSMDASSSSNTVANNIFVNCFGDISLGFLSSSSTYNDISSINLTNNKFYGSGNQQVF